jgi:YHS domain-containing protein
MKDVVCGMNVNSKAIKSAFNGKDYYFCSYACKRKFDKDPSKYIR